MSFFNKSPLEASIERACSVELLGADWNLNLQICDAINAQGELGCALGEMARVLAYCLFFWGCSAKQAEKALRKRLNNRNPKVVTLALMV